VCNADGKRFPGLALALALGVLIALAVATFGGFEYHRFHEHCVKKEQLTMRDATRVIRAGRPDVVQGEPFLPGPTFANPYHLMGDPSSSPYSYGRYHNPTWTHFEQALSELEGGPVILFASGMAAVTAVFGCALHPGSILLMPSDGYYTARVLAEGFFASRGIEVRLTPTAGNAQLEHLDGTTLLWLETPSNPGLDVCDLATLIAAAHQRGVLVAVDNTTATLLGQRPLAFGADFSVSSDSKAPPGTMIFCSVMWPHERPPGRSACIPFGASRERCQARWRSGWPIARLRRWTCAWSGKARTPWPLPTGSRLDRRSRSFAIPALRKTPLIHLRHDK
jgi:hypothetical protein